MLEDVQIFFEPNVDPSPYRPKNTVKKSQNG